VCARQHIDAGNSEIRAPGLQHGSDQTIAATDVEHAGGGRHKLGKPFRKGFQPSVENQLLVQNSDRPHRVCSVQRGAVRRISEETLIMTYDQGDEADWVAERDHRLAVVHANELQLLRIRGADGNNHASTFA
jgi:hypothetical protein